MRSLLRFILVLILLTLAGVSTGYVLSRYPMFRTDHYVTSPNSDMAGGETFTGSITGLNGDTMLWFEYEESHRVGNQTFWTTETVSRQYFQGGSIDVNGDTYSNLLLTGNDLSYDYNHATAQWFKVIVIWVVAAALIFLVMKFVPDEVNLGIGSRKPKKDEFTIVYDEDEMKAHHKTFNDEEEMQKELLKLMGSNKPKLKKKKKKEKELVFPHPDEVGFVDKRVNCEFCRRSDDHVTICVHCEKPRCKSCANDGKCGHECGHEYED